MRKKRLYAEEIMSILVAYPSLLEKEEPFQKLKFLLELVNGYNPNHNKLMRNYKSKEFVGYHNLLHFYNDNIQEYKEYLLVQDDEKFITINDIPKNLNITDEQPLHNKKEILGYIKANITENNDFLYKGILLLSYKLGNPIFPFQYDIKELKKESDSVVIEEPNNKLVGVYKKVHELLLKFPDAPLSFIRKQIGRELYTKETPLFDIVNYLKNNNSYSHPKKHHMRVVSDDLRRL